MVALLPAAEDRARLRSRHGRHDVVVHIELGALGRAAQLLGDRQAALVDEALELGGDGGTTLDD